MDSQSIGPGSRYAHNCNLVAASTTILPSRLLFVFGGARGTNAQVLTDLYALDLGTYRVVHSQRVVPPKVSYSLNLTI